MPDFRKDREYMSIVDDIVDSKEFMEIDKIEHHGITRRDHSIKVSYYAYKIAKTMHLNYRDVARGGLLHDFFLSPEDRTNTQRFISTFTHPKKAAYHADEIFGINDKEENIIKGHMFPLNINVPKTSEAWIVNLVDKTVGGYELTKKAKTQISYSANLYTIFFINFIMRFF